MISEEQKTHRWSFMKVMCFVLYYFATTSAVVVIEYMIAKSFLLTIPLPLALLLIFIAIVLSGRVVIKSFEAMDERI